jgi:hypothetical protein
MYQPKLVFNGTTHSTNSTTLGFTVSNGTNVSTAFALAQERTGDGDEDQEDTDRGTQLLASLIELSHTEEAHRALRAKAVKP